MATRTGAIGNLPWVRGTSQPGVRMAPRGAQHKEAINAELAAEGVKIGGKQFIQKYGLATWTAINSIDTQNQEFEKNIKDIDEGKDKEEEVSTELSTQVKEEPPKLPEEEPEGPDIGTELATEAAIQSKKLLEDKEPDVSEQTKELLGTAKAYKGPIEITDRLSMDLIKDLTKQFHLGDYGTGLEGFKKEQAGDFPKMPHQYKKYMNYVLEDKLIKKYPNIFEQKNIEDAIFYMFTPIYSDMANKAYGREVDLGDPSAKELPGIKKIFALDDEGLPLAAASYDTSDKDAYKIMEVGSLHKGSLDMLLATIKKQAIDKNKKYLILEDLSSKESYNAFKARGFKPIPKHLKEKYGGGIVNRPSWRLLKKHVVKSKNLYMPLEHLTEKELLEDLKVDKEMDKLFDQHILSRSYKTSKSIDPKEKRMKGRYFTSIGKK